VSGTEAVSRPMRVVVADDDAFTVSLVTGGLAAQGFEVFPAQTVEEAWALVESEDPHALISDLDFGGGVSGVSLLRRVGQEYPWVGLVVLTAHRSPQLAVDNPAAIPRSAVYLVKSALRQVEDLAEAVRSSIAGGAGDRHIPGADDAAVITITRAQAEVLRMLASGASTRVLAEHRGTTIRAAETMLTRLYGALGVEISERSNPRVEAVRIWQQGRVVVR
jgi:DNA-binding NarL/FixJ family response regulator